MHLAIDWFSTLLFLAAYAFSQIRAVPPRLGYSALAIACVVIAIYRYRLASTGINLLFVGVAAALALYYGSRALAGGRRVRVPPPSDD